MRANLEYWVDGYNVIFALRIGEGASLSERRAELISRAATLGRRVWIVFDSRDPGAQGMHQGRGRVQVTFARDGRTADQVITDKARSLAGGDAVAVVTGDRELAGRCSQQGARIMAPAKFAELLLPATPVTDEGRDRRLSREEVKEWLKFFGVNPPEKRSRE